MITQVIIVALAVALLLLLCWWLSYRRPSLRPELLPLGKLDSWDPELEELLDGQLVREAVDEALLRELPGDGNTTMCRLCGLTVPLSFMGAVSVCDGIFDCPVIGEETEVIYCRNCLDAEEYPPGCLNRVGSHHR